MHAADIIMEKMHQYRPEFICKAFDLPSYYTAENVDHNCTHTSNICVPNISFLAEDDVDEAEDDTHTICGDWPFVHPGTYHSTADEKGIASLTMEVYSGFHLCRAISYVVMEQIAKDDLVLYYLFLGLSNMVIDIIESCKSFILSCRCKGGKHWVYLWCKKTRATNQF